MSETDEASQAAQAARLGEFKILVSTDNTGKFVTIEFLKGSPVDGGIKLEPAGKIPFACLMAATEHLMRLTAQESACGFDKALAILVEGAKVNQDLNTPERMTY